MQTTDYRVYMLSKLIDVNFDRNSYWYAFDKKPQQKFQSYQAICDDTNT